MKSDKELIKSTIDLAASRIPQDEWPTFSSIANAFQELCFQLNIDKTVEKRCYQALLLMSADDSNKTWYNKVERLQDYMRADSRAPKYKLSPAKNKTELFFHNKHSSPHVMSLAASWSHKGTNNNTLNSTSAIPASRLSTTSPSTLAEGHELSILLNGTFNNAQKQADLSRRENEVSLNRSAVFEYTTGHEQSGYLENSFLSPISKATTHTHHNLSTPATLQTLTKRNIRFDDTTHNASGLTGTHAHVPGEEQEERLSREIASTTKLMNQLEYKLAHQLKLDPHTQHEQSGNNAATESILGHFKDLQAVPPPEDLRDETDNRGERDGEWLDEERRHSSYLRHRSGNNVEQQQFQRTHAASEDAMSATSETQLSTAIDAGTNRVPPIVPPVPPLASNLFPSPSHHSSAGLSHKKTLTAGSAAGGHSDDSQINMPGSVVDTNHLVSNLSAQIKSSHVMRKYLSTRESDDLTAFSQQSRNRDDTVAAAHLMDGNAAHSAMHGQSGSGRNRLHLSDLESSHHQYDEHTMGSSDRYNHSRSRSGSRDRSSSPVRSRHQSFSHSTNSSAAAHQERGRGHSPVRFSADTLGAAFNSGTRDVHSGEDRSRGRSGSPEHHSSNSFNNSNRYNNSVSLQHSLHGGIQSRIISSGGEHSTRLSSDVLYDHHSMLPVQVSLARAAQHLRSVDDLGLEQTQLDGVGGAAYLSSVRSNVKLLALFQKWVFVHATAVTGNTSGDRAARISRGLSQYFNNTVAETETENGFVVAPTAAVSKIRSVVLMLHHHLTSLNDYVGSLFGLEQWLRNKAKELVAIAAKCFVFRTWAIYSEVNATARMFHAKSLLRLGFERFLEYNMKQRVYRRNTVHALAAKRTHVNKMFMSPALHKKRPRLQFSLRGDSHDGNSTQQGYDNTEQWRDEDKNTGIGGGSPSSYFFLHSIEDRLAQKQQQKQMELNKLNNSGNSSAIYSTSVSVRDTLNSLKQSMHLHSRGSVKNLEVHKVRFQEYLYTQDLIHLLFMFRRFYHRTVYIPRLARVRAAVRSSRTRRVFALWSVQCAQRIREQQMMEPKIARTHNKVLTLRLRQAFRRLHTHVSLARTDKEQRYKLNHRIRSNPVYVRALYLIRNPLFVRCFDVLKRNYLKNGLLPSRKQYFDEFKEQQSVSHLFRHWKKWCSGLSGQRLHRSKGAHRDLVLLALYQKRHPHHYTTHPASQHNTAHAISQSFPNLSALHISQHTANKAANLIAMRRAMGRLKRWGKATRVYFSLMELRFAQNLAHHGATSDRRKFTRLANLSSCRLLPAIDTHKSAWEGERSDSYQRRQSAAGKERVSGTASHGAESKQHKLVCIDPHTQQLRVCVVANVDHNSSASASSAAQQQFDRNVSSPGGGWFGTKSISAHVSSSSLLLDDGSHSNLPQHMARTAHKISRYFDSSLGQKAGSSSGAVLLANIPSSPATVVTPLVLKLMRRWIQFWLRQHRLREVRRKVMFKNHRLRNAVTWSVWVQVFAQQQRLNRHRRRMAFNKLQAFCSQHQRSVESRVLAKQVHLRSCLLRWARNATLRAESRRLHSGHVLNAVMDTVDGGTNHKIPVARRSKSQQLRLSVHFLTKHRKVSKDLKNLVTLRRETRFPDHHNPKEPTVETLNGDKTTSSKSIGGNRSSGTTAYKSARVSSGASDSNNVQSTAVFHLASQLYAGIRTYKTLRFFLLKLRGVAARSVLTRNKEVEVVNTKLRLVMARFCINKKQSQQQRRARIFFSGKFFTAWKDDYLAEKADKLIQTNIALMRASRQLWDKVWGEKIRTAWLRWTRFAVHFRVVTHKCETVHDSTVQRVFFRSMLAESRAAKSFRKERLVKGLRSIAEEHNRKVHQVASVMLIKAYRQFNALQTVRVSLSSRCKQRTAIKEADTFYNLKLLGIGLSAFLGNATDQHIKALHKRSAGGSSSSNLKALLEQQKRQQAHCAHFEKRLRDRVLTALSSFRQHQEQFGGRRAQPYCHNNLQQRYLKVRFDPAEFHEALDDHLDQSVHLRPIYLLPRVKTYPDPYSRYRGVTEAKAKLLARKSSVHNILSQFIKVSSPTKASAHLWNSSSATYTAATGPSTAALPMNRSPAPLQLLKRSESRGDVLTSPHPRHNPNHQPDNVGDFAVTGTRSPDKMTRSPFSQYNMHSGNSNNHYNNTSSYNVHSSGMSSSPLRDLDAFSVATHASRSYRGTAAVHTNSTMNMFGGGVANRNHFSVSAYHNSNNNHNHASSNNDHTTGNIFVDFLRSSDQRSPATARGRSSAGPTTPQTPALTAQSLSRLFPTAEGGEAQQVEEEESEDEEVHSFDSAEDAPSNNGTATVTENNQNSQSRPLSRAASTRSNKAKSSGPGTPSTLGVQSAGGVGGRRSSGYFDQQTDDLSTVYSYNNNGRNRGLSDSDVNLVRGLGSSRNRAFSADSSESVSVLSPRGNASRSLSPVRSSAAFSHTPVRAAASSFASRNASGNTSEPNTPMRNRTPNLRIDTQAAETRGQRLNTGASRVSFAHFPTDEVADDVSELSPLGTATPMTRRGSRFTMFSPPKDSPPNYLNSASTYTLIDAQQRSVGGGTGGTGSKSSLKRRMSTTALLRMDAAEREVLQDTASKLKVAVRKWLRAHHWKVFPRHVSLRHHRTQMSCKLLNLLRRNALVRRHSRSTGNFAAVLHVLRRWSRGVQARVESRAIVRFSANYYTVFALSRAFKLLRRRLLNKQLHHKKYLSAVYFNKRRARAMVFIHLRAHCSRMLAISAADRDYTSGSYSDSSCSELPRAMRRVRSPFGATTSGEAGFLGGGSSSGSKLKRSQNKGVVKLQGSGGKKTVRIQM